MTDASLPQNVYRLAQKEFDAIPGSPWVYKILNSIRRLFLELHLLSSVATPRQGLTTADNPRFIRFWWEISQRSLGIGCQSRGEALVLNKRWFPLVKGSHSGKWYGGEIEICNWYRDGEEIKAYIVERYPYLNGNWEWVAKNPEYYFREGAAYSAVTSGGLSFRWMPFGFICEHASNAIYSEHDDWSHISLVGIFNSTFANYIVGLNETINVNIDDLLRMPIFEGENLDRLENLVRSCILTRLYEDTFIERYRSFISPPLWPSGLQKLTNAQSRLSDLDAQIDHEVYRLYAISNEDRTAIEMEITGGVTGDVGEQIEGNNDEGETVEAISAMTPQELAVRWISYAVGLVLGRFLLGVEGSLGSAIYSRSEFSIDSLPTPDEAEFDELVGSPDQFAYVDDNGGRHVFSAQVEKALQNLSLPDGIAVLDEGHPRDLPNLVEKALTLMLGEQAAREVIREATGGDSSTSLSAGASTSLSARLRKFLEKDFFTGWHFKWYRKRPVYWPIQSSKRSYGFVLFHEKITHDTFYTIQREPYLDTKRNAVALKMADLQAGLARATGTARKRLERELDDLRKLSHELAEFAKELEAITLGGYEPEPDWIDDGVVLRMAPLWKVIPIWKSEPKKYWERLEAGDYDWSHIAMKYWPERVREKCKTNKSYAIAHGHEEWYEGDC